MEKLVNIKSCLYCTHCFRLSQRCLKKNRWIEGYPMIPEWCPLPDADQANTVEKKKLKEEIQCSICFYRSSSKKDYEKHYAMHFPKYKDGLEGSIWSVRNGRLIVKPAMCKYCGLIVHEEEYKDHISKCLDFSFLLTCKFKTKYKEGFVQSELADLLKYLPNIDLDMFNYALMGNTCIIKNDEMIHSRSDIQKALVCGIEKRNLRLYEFE